MRPKANPNRGPGDWLPPDEPELDQTLIDEAREALDAEREDDENPPTEDAVIARAWALHDAAIRESRDAEAEMRAWDREDDLPY